MIIGAIIQARMGSTRLPGKVVLPLQGKPVLWHVLNRVKASKKIQKIVLATTDLPEDKPLAKIAKELGIETYFGSAENVLSRYYEAAKKYSIDPVVRITADCPVIDPVIIDEVIDFYLKGNYHYCSLNGSFPDGLDVAIYSFEALQTAHQEAKLPSQREHVGGNFFSSQPKRFQIGSYIKFKDMGNFRWTLDEPEDYELIKKIYAALYDKDPLFSHQDIFQLMKAHPELLQINSHIIRNEGYLKSLEQDKKQTQK